jgi:O-antigen/teichoic acid export membrane protein
MGLAKQITGNAAYRGLFLVFQLLNTMLISRLTGPSGFGIYSLVIVNANFFLMLSSLGIPSGLLYHASVKDVSLSKLLRITWVSSLLQFILIIAIEFLYHLFTGYFLIWNESSLWAGVAGIAFFIIIVMNEKYYALLNGYGKLKTYNRITAFLNIFLFVLLVILFFFPVDNVLVTAIIIFIGVQLLQLIFLALSFHLTVKPVSLVKFASGKALMTYSLIAYFSNAVYFLLTRIDFWILEYYKGSEQLGIYALAVRIIQILLLIPTLLSSIILPSVTSDAFNNRSLERILRLLNTLNLVVVMMILVFAKWVIPLIFGNSFSDSVWPLILLLPGIVFLSAQTFLASYFAGKGKLKINLYSTLIALVIAVSLDFLLIPAFGVVGAAIASSISYMFCFLYSFYSYSTREHYPFSSLIMNSKDWLWLRDFIVSGWQQIKTA